VRADRPRHLTEAGARPASPRSEATAAAIYGIIVSSAVMASAHDDSVLKLAVAVLATLLIYWAADAFAHVMGERIIHAPELTLGRLRRHSGTGWELVSASFLPLGVLLAQQPAGRDVDDAVLAGAPERHGAPRRGRLAGRREAALSTSSRLLSGAPVRRIRCGHDRAQVAAALMVATPLGPLR
jgi:hypothetical protein